MEISIGVIGVYLNFGTTWKVVEREIAIGRRGKFCL